MWTRRDFLQLSGAAALALPAAAGSPTLRLFLCGDVMLGRGIDQVLPHPSDPRIAEPYMRSARGYVELAERVNGKIPAPVNFSYVWGDAIAEMQRADLRIVNLETSITRSDDREAKGINYRMHPDNARCLTAAAIDACVLANNHVLDWGTRGLEETLATLAKLGLKTAGAGRTFAEAAAPAVLTVVAGVRLLVFAFGTASSGIPRAWAAAADEPGVHRLPDLSPRTLARIAAQVGAARRPGDRVVASIHWGGNWGYRVPREHRDFARGLIDRAGVDVVHGHSSHHPKGIEVYRGRPILYGCGDFVNDYEGIGGHREFRSELVLGYLVTLASSSGELLSLEMAPFVTRRFRLRRTSNPDAQWLRRTLDRECRELGTEVRSSSADRLVLGW